MSDIAVEVSCPNDPRNPLCGVYSGKADSPRLFNQANNEIYLAKLTTGSWTLRFRNSTFLTIKTTDRNGLPTGSSVSNDTRPNTYHFTPRSTQKSSIKTPAKNSNVYPDQTPKVPVRPATNQQAVPPQPPTVVTTDPSITQRTNPIRTEFLVDVFEYQAPTMTKTILVPSTYLSDYDASATTERRANKVVATHIFNIEAVRAFNGTVKACLEELERLQSVLNETVIEKNRAEEARRESDRALIAKARSSGEASSKAEEKDVEIRRLNRTIESITRESAQQFEDCKQLAEKLKEKDRDIELLQAQLQEIKQEQSRVLLTRDKEYQQNINDKQTEIHQLKERVASLEKALKDNSTTSTASKSEPPSMKLPAVEAPSQSESHLPPTPSTVSTPVSPTHANAATPGRKRYLHTVRDAADQDIRSSFPTGFVFSQRYKEVTLKFGGTFSNLIGACEAYPKYRHLLDSLSEIVELLFKAAEKLVSEFSEHSIGPLPKGCNWNEIDSGTEGYRVSQYQTVIYEQVLKAANNLVVSSLDAQLITFQSNLVEFFEYETKRLNRQPADRRETRILDNGVLTLVLDYVRSCTLFLWYAKYSDPPCELSYRPGTVIKVTEEDSLDEVMKRRPIKKAQEELILFPALRFHRKDGQSSHVPVTGLSFAQAMVDTSNSIISTESNDNGGGGMHNIPTTPPEETPKSTITVPTAVTKSAAETINYTQLPARRLGLRNTGNSCFLNAALQLIAHAPPLVYLLTNEITRLALTSKATKDIYLYPVILKLLGQMVDIRSETAAVDTVYDMKDAITKIHPDLYRGHEQRDAGTVLKVMVQHLKKEICESNRMASLGMLASPHPLQIPGFQRFPRYPSYHPHLQPAIDSWAALMSREYSSNPIMDVAFPQRRCRRRCSHCRNETASFDVVTMIPLPIPTESDYQAIVATQESMPASATTAATKPIVEEKKHEINVVVQLLEGVPAMLCIPMAVSMDMTIGELKEELLQQLYTARRLTPGMNAMYNTHFHFSCLEKNPVRSSQAHPLLRLVRSGNGSGNATEVDLKVTINDILSTNMANSVLVASQLDYPTPSSNSYHAGGMSNYMYYDISFGYHNYNPRAFYTEFNRPPSVFLIDSIPIRLSFVTHGKIYFPDQSDIEASILKLASKVFESTEQKQFKAVLHYLREDCTETEDHKRNECQRIAAILRKSAASVNSQNSNLKYEYEYVRGSLVYTSPTSREISIFNLMDQPRKLVVRATNESGSKRQSSRPTPRTSFTLQDSMAASCLPKPINSTCSRCRAADGQQLMYDYWQCGEVLFLQLERFTSPAAAAGVTTREANAAIWRTCDFPFEGLDIRTLTNLYDTSIPAVSAAGQSASNAADDAPSDLYDLYGVVEHRELTLNYGHFIATCRTSVLDPQSWYRFDDERVTQVSPTAISKERAYLLCYVRRSVAPQSSATTVTTVAATHTGSRVDTPGTGGVHDVIGTGSIYSTTGGSMYNTRGATNRTVIAGTGTFVGSKYGYK